MTEKILAAVDTTDRADGKALTWDAANSVHVYASVAGVSSAVLANEFRNFPSIEVADNAQPEWWEESASATLTEVDVAGESITETWERCLKVVTSANDHYAYQRYTYADEPRLKSGRTVSARVAVWSVSSAAARVSLVSSVGELGVSSDTVAAAWTILTVEGEVLDGTTIDVRCEVDNGTAYFVPLAFGVGSTAPYELAPRGMRFVYKPAVLATLSTVADPAAWTDLDCTSAMSPLAAVGHFFINGLKANSSGWDIFARRNGTSDTPDAVWAVTSLNGTVRVINDFPMQMDDGQVIEYFIDRWTGTGTFDVTINQRGYWEWA